MSWLRAPGLTALLLVALPATAAPLPDAWSPLVTLRSADATRWLAPIHATSMPDGTLSIIAQTRPAPLAPTELTRFVFSLTPTPAGEPLPPEMFFSPQEVPLVLQDRPVGALVVDDYLYCAGHTLTADGRLFAVGGTRALRMDGADVMAFGFDYGLVSDGNRWLRVPAPMVGRGPRTGRALRWYPTVTRLADGRLLVVGGYEVVVAGDPGFANRSVEIFDPATGAWSLVSTHGQSPPEIFGSDYTHVFLLPSPVGDAGLLLLGDEGVPVYLSLAGGELWSTSAAERPEKLAGELPSQQASSLLLPIRLDDAWGYPAGSVLVAGGATGTSALSSYDVYRPQDDLWTRYEMGVEREHPATVLLPDGRVLVLAGHHEGDASDTLVAQYVDPATGFSLAEGTALMAGQRDYHTAATLLPDGRVLVAGGRRGDWYAFGTERVDLTYYSPSYLFAGPRPRIDAAPRQVSIVGEFTVAWSGPAPVTEVVLLGLPSMTHSFDMNQRHVELEIVGSEDRPGGGTLTVAGPPDETTAPPGPYLLFVLDDSRVPSIGRVVALR